jgi:hypothetical protein
MLYYRDLISNATQKSNGNSGIVKDWAAAVSKLSSSSSKPSSTTHSSRSHTFFTERSTSSKTSHNQHSTTSKLGAKKATDLPNDADSGSNGAFSDNDETVGNKRDAAVNSPPKNGVRATSSVRICSSLVYYMYYANLRLGYCKDQGPETDENIEGPTTWEKRPKTRS